MKRIRIGNDIRVQTSLHDLNDFDITSIKQLRCYFIPQYDSYTTPNDTYDPMQYNVCNCGKPKYNVFPCNIDAPHWFCGYNGFGVNSKRFIHVDNKFLAPSRLLAEQNRIEAYFPAKAQYQIGEYKFVIVLTIYQPGWCEDNLRTITLDEGVIFALTSDDRDTDTDTIIDLDIPNVTSIVVPDKVVLQHTSHLNIGDLGYDGTAYNVRINYSDGSHKLVNADEFSKLITVVTGATGDITVAETGMIARLNMFENVDEQVTYQLKENPSIKDTMRIVSSGRMYRINYNYDSNYVTVNGNDSAYVDDTTKTGDALPVATFTVIPTNDEYTMTSLDMEITGASLSNKPDPNTSVTKAEVTIATPVTLDEITVTITASQFRP